MKPSAFSFIDDNVAGSNYPYTEEQIRSVYNSGITDIISLTPSSPKELIQKTGLPIRIHHFPSSGRPHPDTIEEIIRIIQDGKTEGRKFMIHCQFGQERTGIVLAAYLENEKKIGKRETIDLLHKLRPISLKSRDSVSYFLSLKITK